jgi:hypothetical protein
MKEQIEKLKISGRVYIWKYTDNDRNYPGWNMTVDNSASQELSQLLDMMEKCEWSTNKNILTTRPTDNEISAPNNKNGVAKWTTKSKIIFSLKTNMTPDFWVTTETADELEISFGKEKLKELKEAIINISKGKGDHSIADKDDNNILTFWWRVGK